jgi:hypothetical protein
MFFFNNQVVCKNFQGEIGVVRKIDAQRIWTCAPRLRPTNMQKQVDIVLRPFLDLMDCFKLSKVRNMVVLMLDPYFKDLSLMGDYVGHFFTIEIVIAYDS